MNERIKLLAEEAGFMDSWFSESGDDCEQELKKFAELIVGECMYVGRLSQINNGLVDSDIKDHFYGVEE